MERCTVQNKHGFRVTSFVRCRSWIFPLHSIHVPVDVLDGDNSIWITEQVLPVMTGLYASPIAARVAAVTCLTLRHESQLK